MYSEAFHLRMNREYGGEVVLPGYECHRRFLEREASFLLTP